jgi:SAM-dependent methyltransferase
MRKTLRETALRFPDTLVEAQLQEVPRTAFHLGLLRRSVGAHASVCEIGGGTGLFSPGCAALGIQVTLVDELPGHPAGLLDLHRALGVKLVSRDVLYGKAEFPPNHFDAVASFDGVRHLHTSPDGFFRRLKSWLRPGGAFILGVHNGARYRSREPYVSDLKSLAKSMELRSVRILGRHWLRSQRTPLHRGADHLLRLRPSLCADLYLIGHK